MQVADGCGRRAADAGRRRQCGARFPRAADTGATDRQLPLLAEVPDAVEVPVLAVMASRRRAPLAAVLGCRCRRLIGTAFAALRCRIADPEPVCRKGEHGQ